MWLSPGRSNARWVPQVEQYADLIMATRSLYFAFFVFFVSFVVIPVLHSRRAIVPAFFGTFAGQ